MKTDDEFLISIIVPIYNVELYLRRCVYSLITQTYKKIEIILVDDGSPDRCGEICDEYAKADSRVRVIHKTNGGLSSARNAALDIATGDYIMFVDSDDWIESNCCEELVKKIMEYNADIVAFGLNYVYDSGKIVKSLSGLTGLADKEMCMEYLIHNVNKGGVFNYACNKIFLSELFSNLRFPIGFLAEDQDITYKLIHKSKRIYVTDIPFYNYYQRNNSIASSQYAPQLIKDRHVLWEKRLDFLKQEYPNLLNYQIAELLGTAYVGLVKLQGNSNCEDIWNMLNGFVEKYKNREEVFLKFDRRIKLRYYSYPLFWLYVKLFVK